MKRRLFYSFLVILLVVSSIGFGGCKKIDKTGKQEEEVNYTVQVLQTQKPEIGEEIAVITTNYGNFKVRFFPEQAPKAVENFKTLAKERYFNGLIFHRVVHNFMIQSGDPTGTGTSGTSIWGKPFEDEFSDELHNFRGALSMANNGADTNGSQFFIVQKPSLTENEIAYYQAAGYFANEEDLAAYKELGGTPWLDGMHTVFGQVFEGMAIVDRIASVAVNQNSRPLTEVIIKSVEIVEYSE